MNLDTGVAESTFLIEFSVQKALETDARIARRVEHALQTEVHGNVMFTMEQGLSRTLNGRLAGVHKTLCSAGPIACRGGLRDRVIVRCVLRVLFSRVSKAICRIFEYPCKALLDHAWRETEPLAIRISSRKAMPHVVTRFLRSTRVLCYFAIL